jgi:hypothetical protein
VEWQNLESISNLIRIQVCKWKEEREPNWVQKMNKLHTLGAWRISIHEELARLVNWYDLLVRVCLPYNQSRDD